MIGKTQAKRRAKQLFRLCLVNDLLDENRVRQVAQYAITAGYRDCGAILKHLLRLVRLDRAQHSANVESATALPDDLQASITAGLTSRYGASLITAFIQRPSLIGGVRIQAGWQVYDSSVRAGLEALEKAFDAR